ncbi:MAG: SBBP repeat-containing protein [Armatimonadota bacterium]
MQPTVRSQWCNTLVLGAVALVGVLMATGQGAAPAAAETGLAGQTVWLEPNLGQSDDRVQFIARSPAYHAILTSKGMEIAPAPRRRGARMKTQLTMTVVGANSRAETHASEELPTRSNYFIGDRAQREYRDVPQFGRVEYDEVYPGVDLVYYRAQNSLKYDFVVAPGRDPDIVRLRFEGAKQIRVADNGDLVLRTSEGELRHEKPFIYQDVNGVRKPVSGGYELSADNQVGFVVGSYDASRPLVIDPTMTYSVLMDHSGGVGVVTATRVSTSTDPSQTKIVYVLGTGNNYVGGNWVQCIVISKHEDPDLDPFTDATRPWQQYYGVSTANSYDGGIFVDSNGAVYVTGYVASNGNDVCIYKINPTTSGVDYSCTVGGTGDDRGYDIAADGDGDIYVTGYTNGNFPTTTGAYQTSYGGSGDAFVLKRNPGTNTTVYSTYLGGSDNDAPSPFMGLAVDGSEQAYVGGTVATGSVDGYVKVLNSSGSGLVYNTSLGGSSADYVYDLAIYPDTVNGGAYAFVTGETSSSNFPVTTGALDTTYSTGYMSFSQRDAFVAKLSSSGSIVYSTYLGGERSYMQSSGFGDDFGYGIAVDADENGNVFAYVTGGTTTQTSPGFPRVNPVDYRPGNGTIEGNSNAGYMDVFVSKLNHQGTALEYSTYIGANHSEHGTGIAVDADGRAFFCGSTYGGIYPASNAPNYGSGYHFLTVFE